MADPDDAVRTGVSGSAPKAGELVARHLRRRIVLGELQEGELLPSEAALMAEFGVSRPTLREAFRILDSESIISVRRGAHGGAQVMVPDRRVAARHAGLVLQYRGVALADVYDARATLETSAVATLARSRGADALAALEAAVAAAEPLVNDAVAFADADASFHRLVVRLAGNSTIELMADLLYFIIESHNRSYLATHDHAAESAAARAAQRAHRELIALVRARSAKEAPASWQHHLELVKEYMIDDPATAVVEILS